LKGTIHKQWFVDRDIYVYLPPSYGTSGASYPVVYIQDGDYLITGAVEQFERRFAEGRLQEAILVAIEPVDRNVEYTPWFAPWLAPERYPGTDGFGGQGKAYLAFIVEQLKPYIDGKYDTDARAEATGMAGGSFGGLISLYGAYLYPDVFGRFALLSASFWYERMMDYMRNQPLSSDNRRLFMYVGSDEGNGKTTIQIHMVPYTREAHRLLLDSGFTEETVKFVEEQGGIHREEYFIRFFPDALEWLFPAGSGSDSGTAIKGE